MPAQDPLNRITVNALMVAFGIDGFAVLARRMTRAAADLNLDATFERSYVSRVMRGDRKAQASFIVCCARALGVGTVAITGEGVEITADDLEAVAS